MHPLNPTHVLMHIAQKFSVSACANYTVRRFLCQEPVLPMCLIEVQIVKTRYCYIKKTLLIFKYILMIVLKGAGYYKDTITA